MLKRACICAQVSDYAEDRSSVIPVTSGIHLRGIPKVVERVEDDAGPLDSGFRRSDGIVTAESDGDCYGGARS